MDEIVLLESKRGKLMKDRFVYDGQAYLISDIRRASLKSEFFQATMLVLKSEFFQATMLVLKSEFFQATMLVLKLKNGENKEFRIGTASTAAPLNVLMTGGLVDTVSQDVRMSTQQWVTTINMLIAMTGNYGNLSGFKIEY